MVTVTGSGSQTAVITTEHTLFESTTSKFYSAYIDLVNMVGGDTVEIRLYVIIKTAGTYSQYFVNTYTGAQTNDLVYIPPMPTSTFGYKITLTQTAGTARVFDWQIFEV